MKRLLLALLLLSAGQARAITADEFVAQFAAADEITRSAEAFDYCTDLFIKWPTETYRTDIVALGAHYTSSPDAAYYLLNSCQTLWVSSYLDPIKSKLSEISIDHARAAYYLSNLDLLRLPKYLGAEIRIFSVLGKASNAQIPPAPYELLTHMASSDRDVDEVIHQEMREAFSALAGAGGMIAGFRVAKAVAGGWSARAGAAARVSKTAIIAAIAAAASYELVDAGLHHLRQKQLWDPVAQLTYRLSQNDTSAPAPVLLDEFYKAAIRLGYFYSYGLYLDESGKGTESGAAANKSCEAQIKAYFIDPAAAASSNMLYSFIRRQTCGDAVSVWIAAGEFLKAKFPKSSAAELISARLIARAKRTFLSYEETAAYEGAQPICDYELGTGTFQCRDRQSGNALL